MTTILVVDDASFMRTVLKDILKSNGLSDDIIEAQDGIEAVRQYIKHKPDLVTMDVNMPKADGVQALKGIIKVNPNARVIMVTSVEQQDIIDDAINSGAKGYVKKPIDENEILHTVNEILN